jgi:proteasome lid subunit RPN8/RPN11
MKTEKNLSLALPRQLANQILAHAQHNPDTEICGLISAQNHQAKHYYPVPNIAASSATLFQMDAQAQIAAMKEMRAQHEELLAIVHSHPHSIAEPSALDQAQHQYPEAYYLIVSLNTVGVLELRAFRQIDLKFEPVELILEHPTH